MFGRDPASVVEPCTRCGMSVYVTHGSDRVPDGHEESEFMPACTRCIVSDPEMRSSTAPGMLRSARKLHAFVDWPVGL